MTTWKQIRERCKSLEEDNSYLAARLNTEIAEKSQIRCENDSLRSDNEKKDKIIAAVGKLLKKSSSMPASLIDQIRFKVAVSLLEGNSVDPDDLMSILDQEQVKTTDLDLSNKYSVWALDYSRNPQTCSRSVSENQCGGKIYFIKGIRSILNIGLREAKDFSESLPRMVKDNLTFEEATSFANKLMFECNGFVLPEIRKN